MEKHKTIIKGNRSDGTPFVGCFDDIVETYNRLTKECTGKSVNAVLSNVPLWEPKKIVLIHGKSSFEYTKDFYDDVHDRIVYKWTERKKDNLVLIIFLEFMNSSSSKAILEIIKSVLSNFKERCHVLWVVDDTDENMLTSAIETKGILDDKPEFIVKEIELLE